VKETGERDAGASWPPQKMIIVLSPKPSKVFKSHEKHNWAVDESGQPNVLIDDFEINTIPWEQAGGIAILHTDTNSTIQQLEELMKK